MADSACAALSSVDEPDEIILERSRLRAWFACRTSSQLQQPALERLLVAAQIEIYSPRQLVMVGAVATIRPLISGYIFVHVDKPVFDIRDHRILYVSQHGAPLVVADGDIERLRETEARLLEAPTAPIRPKVGSRIVILAGALIGRQGVIKNSCRGKRFMVAMAQGITASVRSSDVALV